MGAEKRLSHDEGFKVRTQPIDRRNEIVLGPLQAPYDLQGDHVDSIIFTNGRGL